MDGNVGSGAGALAVPLWALRHIGAAFDGGSGRPACGTAGNLHASGAQIDPGNKRGRTRFDMGAADVCAPDTKWPRDPFIPRPFIP